MNTHESLLEPVKNQKPSSNVYERVFVAEFKPILIEVEVESEADIKNKVQSMFREHLLINGLPQVDIQVARKGALTREDIFIGRVVETSDFRTGVVTNISITTKKPVTVRFPNGETGRYKYHELITSDKSINRIRFDYKRYADGLYNGDLCFVNFDKNGLAVYGDTTLTGNRIIHLVRTCTKKSIYLKPDDVKQFLL